MKANGRVLCFAVAVLMIAATLLTACGNKGDNKKTYLSLNVDTSGVGALTDGDLFDPAKLVVTMPADRGADGTLNLKDATVTVDGVTYTGEKIAVHAPSCTIRIVYDQGNGKPVLEAEVTLDVAALDHVHEMEHHPAVAPTENEAGNIEYWSCRICGKLFSDAAGKAQVDDVVVPALGHQHRMVHHPAVAPTQTENGNIEYWSCEGCGKLFSDAEGNVQVNNVIVPSLSHEHDLVHHDAVVPTLEKEGNVEYWSCEGCGKWFLDAEAKQETDSVGVKRVAKVIIMAGQSNMVGHSMVDRLTDAQREKYKAGFPNVLILNSCNPYNPNADKRNLTDSFVPVTLGMGRIPDNTSAWPGGCFGPELGLAEYLSETYPDETFYLIKDATGGSTLSGKWCSPSSLSYMELDALPENSLYAHLLDRVDTGMQLLRDQGTPAQIVALLWMQGENDANSYTAKYDTLWRNFISDLTAEWNAKGYVADNGLATVDGGITEYWTNYEILNAVKELWAAEYSKGYYIDVLAAGLVRKETDPAHLDSDSMITLGRLFGEKLALAISDVGRPATWSPVTLRGSGTAADPFLVGSYEEWLRLAYTAYTDSMEGKYIRLTADIGSAERPVYAALGVTSQKAFAGILDGGGHTICVSLKNYQNTNGARAVGLIGYANGVTVKNLTVAGQVTLTRKDFYAGGFIGLLQWADGKLTTLENCVNLATVTVTDVSNAGGFVGRMLGNLTVIGCTNKGDVTTAGNYAAGIVGYINKSNSGSAPSLTVTDTVNEGNVTAVKGVGGIVGLFHLGAAGGTHTLTRVSNSGKLTGEEQVGGIVGVITSQAAGGFRIAITYLAAGLADEGGADVVVGSDGNKQTTAITKLTSGDDPDSGHYGEFIPFK